MISSLLIIIILVASLSSNINPASSLAFNTSLTRLSSITIILSSFLIMNVLHFNIINNSIFLFSGFLHSNVINLSFQILLLITSALILAAITTNRYFTLPNIKNILITTQQNYLNNFVLVVLFNIIGACLLINTGDTMILYIAIELQSFSLYILSTLKNDSVNSASAGLRYFLIGSLASTLILLGIALLYYATGLTNFENIYLYLNITDFYSSGGYEGGLSANSPYAEFMDFWNLASFNPHYIVIILSFVLIITGLFIKLGAAPFHQWAPDVYALVPTPVTTWLVIIPKISLFILLFNILEMIIGTGNAEGYGGFADFIYQMLDNNTIVKLLSNSSELLEQLELNYFNWNTEHITNLYGEATLFYPHFLQLELINSYGSPILNENIYSRYEDVINSIWNNYYSPRHNLLAYIINIVPLGSISIKNFLIFIAIISLIIGAIGGLYQIKIKRLLAFSAINHIGFLIIALSINNKISLESFIFYLTQYSLTNINVFLILIAFGYINYIYSNQDEHIVNLSKLPINPINYLTNNFKKENYNLSINNSTKLTNEPTDLNFINQLTGIFKNNSILTLSFVICLFSLAGIPPMLGFFAKQQILSAALSVGFIFLSIIAINTSVISAYYYLKLIQVSTFSISNLLSNLLSKNSDNVEPKTNINYFLSEKPNSTNSLNSSYFYSNNTLKNINNNNLTLNSNSNNVITLNDLFNYNSIETTTNLQSKFSNIHSYLISILTLFILLYTFKPNLLLNLTNILTSYSFTL